MVALSKGYILANLTWKRVAAFAVKYPYILWVIALYANIVCVLKNTARVNFISCSGAYTECPYVIVIKLSLFAQKLNASAS